MAEAVGPDTRFEPGLDLTVELHADAGRLRGVVLLKLGENAQQRFRITLAQVETTDVHEPQVLGRYARRLSPRRRRQVAVVADDDRLGEPACEFGSEPP